MRLSRSLMAVGLSLLLVGGCAADHGTDRSGLRPLSDPTFGFVALGISAAVMKSSTPSSIVNECLLLRAGMAVPCDATVVR